MRFSIIVVCLNPGEKLHQTVGSILAQTCQDFEVVVKDGGSRDGSIEKLSKSLGNLESRNIRLYAEKDSGIYDAMNQAAAHARGEFLIFMNCGDVFFDENVLEKIEQYIRAEAQLIPMIQTLEESWNAPMPPRDSTRTTGASRNDETPHTAKESGLDNLILYGNTYSEKNKVIISSPPRITGFTCYRNIPCHQSCVYAARLCKEKPYDLQYKIRADYDHFLWCYYVAGARIKAMDVTVASYEGGGFSEDRKNRKQDGQEHKLITGTYMGKGELFFYRLLLWCTLAPLRRFLAENPAFSGWYHRIKEKLYH